MTTRADLVPVTLTARSPSEIVVHGPDSLYAWWETLHCPVPGAEFTPRFRRGQWDGLYRPGRCLRHPDGTATLRISRGLVHHLTSDFPEITPEAVAPQEHLDLPALVTPPPGLPPLYDYQTAVLTHAGASGWGRVALATNAGKGAIIGLLARGFHTLRNLRTLVLCDERAVYDALHTEITTWAGQSPGEVRAGATDPPEEPVILAMVPTLSRRLQEQETWRTWTRTFSAVLLDEADKATSTSWRRILSHTPQSEYRIGFSGSFPQDDPYADLLLDELMGPILYRVSNATLVARGISARPRVELHPFDAGPALASFFRGPSWDALRQAHADIARSGGATDFQREQHRRLAGTKALLIKTAAWQDNQDRHRFVASLVQPDVPTVVVVNRITHGHLLRHHIPGAVFLDGATSETERNAALDAFRDGHIPVLIVTKIFDRGTNRLGHAADLIFASGEGSTRQTLQRIGRGLRRAGGKEFLRLVDIIDRGHEYLHTAAAKRVRLYHAEGFDVDIVA